jgi:hypothetical protein
MTFKTDAELNAYIDLLASDWDGEQDMYEYAAQTADGCEYVIYTRMAWDLIHWVRTEYDPDYFDVCHTSDFECGHIDELMTKFAYYFIETQIILALQEKVGEQEA